MPVSFVYIMNMHILQKHLFALSGLQLFSQTSSHSIHFLSFRWDLYWINQIYIIQLFLHLYEDRL